MVSANNSTCGGIAGIDFSMCAQYSHYPCIELAIAHYLTALKHDLYALDLCKEIPYVAKLVFTTVWFPIWPEPIIIVWSTHLLWMTRLKCHFIHQVDLHIYPLLVSTTHPNILVLFWNSGFVDLVSLTSILARQLLTLAFSNALQLCPEMTGKPIFRVACRFQFWLVVGICPIRSDC